jgi:beta-lactamase regulating signal transducer with metallopeptidase domain
MWPGLVDESAWIGERLAIGSMQGAVAVGLAWAACRWIPRAPAALQAWVWWLVAVKLVAALLPLPAVPVPLLPASEPGVTVRAPAAAASHPIVVTPETAAQMSPARANRLSVVDLLVAAWLAGVLLHALLLARAAVTTRRLVQRATPLSGVDLAPVSRMAARAGLRRLPRVCASPEVDVPQVVGLWNPVVLLPAGARGHFTDSEWQMALGHELLHVRRRDVLLGCVPALAERLYFFHPLARLAAREYLMAREAACDAAVVRAFDVPADDYGRLLIRLGVTRSQSILVASSAAPSASCLRRRLEMLQHTSSTTVSRMMTATVAATALLALAPVEIVAQRPPAPPALPALPAPPAPPAPPSANARALPPAAPAAPAPPASPAQTAPAAPLPPLPPMAPSAPMPRPAPLPPRPPSPPNSDEVVLRLKSPATEQEALDTAVRVLETQLAQVEQQAANVQVTTLSDAELDQIRRKLEEMMALLQGQASAGQNLQQRSADQLARQMAELNRQREALLRQEQEVQRQLAQTAQRIERMKMELQTAQEAAKKR